MFSVGEKKELFIRKIMKPDASLKITVYSFTVCKTDTGALSKCLMNNHF